MWRVLNCCPRAVQGSQKHMEPMMLYSFTALSQLMPFFFFSGEWLNLSGCAGLDWFEAISSNSHAQTLPGELYRKFLAMATCTSLQPYFPNFHSSVVPVHTNLRCQLIPQGIYEIRYCHSVSRNHCGPRVKFSGFEFSTKISTWVQEGWRWSGVIEPRLKR